MGRKYSLAQCGARLAQFVQLPPFTALIELSQKLPFMLYKSLRAARLHRRYAASNDLMVRIAAIFAMVFNAGIVQANDVDSARIIGTWSVSDAKPRESRNHGAPNVTAPMLISESEIAWDANNHRQCTASYSIVSRAGSPTFPGGPIENDNAADAYTIFQLRLYH